MSDWAWLLYDRKDYGCRKNGLRQDKGAVVCSMAPFLCCVPYQFGLLGLWAL